MEGEDYIAVRCLVEYIWLDHQGKFRGKTRTIYVENRLESIEQIPEWNFDGSSTLQATTNSSEVVLKPVKFVIDPFRIDMCQTISINSEPTIGIIVLCETYDIKNNPLESNKRYDAYNIFDLQNVKEMYPMYGLEQEYIIVDCRNTYNTKTLQEYNRVLCWPKDKNTYPDSQGPYFCGLGFFEAGILRTIMDEHYTKCLIAGLDISGHNIEVLPGQAEFQIGPVIGIDAADQLYIARYILERICEKYGFCVNYDPKPIIKLRPNNSKSEDWNGSGLHVNYSSINMRNENGLEYIYESIDKLKEKHLDHIAVYGDNSNRLTGKHETSSINDFSCGIGDRSASIRINYSVIQDGKGYIEDRRPASDADPYVITSMIANTIHS